MEHLLRVVLRLNERTGTQFSAGYIASAQQGDNYYLFFQMSKTFKISVYFMKVIPLIYSPLYFIFLN